MPAGTKSPPEKREVPSDRKQLNIRMDPETEALVAELLPLAKAVTGLNVSQSDLFRLAIQALRREYVVAGVVREARKK
jgi:hypothetical protein